MRDTRRGRRHGVTWYLERALAVGLSASLAFAALRCGGTLNQGGAADASTAADASATGDASTLPETSTGDADGGCSAIPPSTARLLASGRCLVTLTIDSNASPASLVVQGDHLYWGTRTSPSGSDHVEVRRIHIAGGASEPFALVPTYAGRLAVNESNLFVAVEPRSVFDAGGIWSIDLYDGGGAPITATPSFPQSLAVNGTDVFWSGAPFSGDSISGEGGIFAVPLGGGPTVTVVGGLLAAGAVAIDATHVYFGDLDAGLQEVPIKGGTPTTLTRVVPANIAVDGTSIYWNDLAAGQILSMPIGGGKPVTLWTKPPSDGPLEPGLAIDGTSVYFADQSHVYKAPLGGGSAEMLVDETYTSVIVVDATSVYWVGQAGVMRLSPK